MALVLNVLNGAGGPSYPLDGTITIGRGEGNIVAIEHFDVSRRHAEIKAVGEDVLFLDLGTQHGSKVNGQPVTADVAIRLRPGDRVSIADVMTFEIVEATTVPVVVPPASTPPALHVSLDATVAHVPAPAPPRPVAVAAPVPMVQRTAPVAVPSAPVGSDPPSAPRGHRLLGGGVILAVASAIVILGAVLSVVLFFTGGDDTGDRQFPQSTSVAGSSATAVSSPAAASPTTATPAASTPTATAAPPTATLAGPTRLPSVTPPASANGRSQLTSGVTAVVTTTGCTLRASTEPTEAASPTNRVVLQLCEGDEVVVATNSPAVSTVRVTEGLLFWRVLVKKTGDVLWVKEVEVVSGRRFLTPAPR